MRFQFNTFPAITDDDIHIENQKKIKVIKCKSVILLTLFYVQKKITNIHYPAFLSVFIIFFQYFIIY